MRIGCNGCRTSAGWCSLVGLVSSQKDHPVVHELNIVRGGTGVAFRVRWQGELIGKVEHRLRIVDDFLTKTADRKSRYST